MEAGKLPTIAQTCAASTGKRARGCYSGAGSRGGDVVSRLRVDDERRNVAASEVTSGLPLPLLRGFSVLGFRTVEVPGDDLNPTIEMVDQQPHRSFDISRLGGPPHGPVIFL